jgi:hypothetical protein
VSGSSDVSDCTLLDVRFGSLADIRKPKNHVRFTPESGHVRCENKCPLWANSGHCYLLRACQVRLGVQHNATDTTIAVEHNVIVIVANFEIGLRAYRFQARC